MYITVNKDYEGLSRRSPESRTNGGRKRERWDLHVKRESQRRPARIARGLGEGECECEEGEVHGEIKTEIARLSRSAVENRNSNGECLQAIVPTDVGVAEFHVFAVPETVESHE